MGKMIAYCGIDCGKCEAFIAKKENNNEIREKYVTKQTVKERLTWETKVSAKELVQVKKI